MLTFKRLVVELRWTDKAGRWMARVQAQTAGGFVYGVNLIPRRALTLEESAKKAAEAELKMLVDVGQVDFNVVEEKKCAK